MLDVIADAIFRSPGTPAIPFCRSPCWSWSLLLAASVFVLERRVRGVEVVT